LYKSYTKCITSKIAFSINIVFDFYTISVVRQTRDLKFTQNVKFDLKDNFKLNISEYFDIA